MLTIKTNVLAALLAHAADKGGRETLKGVYIDRTGYLVATDGHQIMFYECADAKAWPIEDTILSRDLIETVLKTAKATKVYEVTFELDYVESDRVIADVGGVRLSGTLCPGPYVTWKPAISTQAKLIGEYEDQSMQRVNFDYLIESVKALKWLSDSKQALRGVSIRVVSNAVYLRTAEDPNAHVMIMAVRGLNEANEYDRLIKEGLSEEAAFATAVHMMVAHDCGVPNF